MYFFLFIISHVSGELPNIIAKDSVTGATFEMKFLSSADEKMNFPCKKTAESIDYLMKNKVYELITNNLPIDTTYSLYYINMEGESMLVDTFTTENGKDWIPVPNGKNIIHKYGCVNKNFLNGECFKLKLISNNAKVSLNLKYIPNPIEYQWQDGASIHIEANERFGESFMLYGIGFKPNEKLSLISMSGNEKCSTQCYVDERGSITIILAPGVIGKKGGGAKFIVIREHDKNEGVLRYYWGDEAIKYKG